MRVSVENGGKTLIEVADDGSGMTRDEAILALDRHATSKIHAIGDLVGIATFGFRGEALPAIASVSRFSLVSASRDGEGTDLGVTGGRVDQVRDAARQRGTTVTARALFFNTPARRKFLRSAASESRTDLGRRSATLALSHPEIGFELPLDGREPADRARRPVPPTNAIAAVWGADLSRSLIPVDYAVGGVRSPVLPSVPLTRSPPAGGPSCSSTGARSAIRSLSALPKRDTARRFIPATGRRSSSTCRSIPAKWT